MMRNRISTASQFSPQKVVIKRKTEQLHGDVWQTPPSPRDLGHYHRTEGMQTSSTPREGHNIVSAPNVQPSSNHEKTWETFYTQTGSCCLKVSRSWKTKADWAPVAELGTCGETKQMCQANAEWNPGKIWIFFINQLILWHQCSCLGFADCSLVKMESFRGTGWNTYSWFNILRPVVPSIEMLFPQIATCFVHSFPSCLYSRTWRPEMSSVFPV